MKNPFKIVTRKRYNSLLIDIRNALREINNLRSELALSSSSYRESLDYCYESIKHKDSRISDLVKSISDENKNTYLVSKLFRADQIFNEWQLAIINSPTPPEFVEVYIDPITGNSYKSVKAAYVKKLVNQVTGGGFDFKVKSREQLNFSEVLVEGCLVINGRTREQFGQYHIDSTLEDLGGGKSIRKPVNVGNAYKAAASDCFKKCAAEFGFCPDIYNANRSAAPASNTAALTAPVDSFSEHYNLSTHNRLKRFLANCKTENDAVTKYNAAVGAKHDVPEYVNTMNEELVRISAVEKQDSIN